ncbi:hypothetical protein, partial [Limosilactobacillus ingluviei]|uniref:hypothetical protein n=1 Tax=Limosilactobacillus ingluviei TaxID=148604 RepID=UPI0024B890A3
VYQFVVPNQRLDNYIITFKLVSRTFFEEVLLLKLSDNSYILPRTQIFVNNNFEFLASPPQCRSFIAVTTIYNYTRLLRIRQALFSKKIKSQPQPAFLLLILLLRPAFWRLTPRV